MKPEKELMVIVRVMIIVYASITPVNPKETLPYYKWLLSRSKYGSCFKKWDCRWWKKEALWWRHWTEIQFLSVPQTAFGILEKSLNLAMSQFLIVQGDNNPSLLHMGAERRLQPYKQVDENTYLFCPSPVLSHNRGLLFIYCNLLFVSILWWFIYLILASLMK